MKEDISWIKNLKIGDEVIIDKSTPFNRNYYDKAIVEKITPTGRLNLSDGNQYYNDGQRVGGERCFTSDLLQVTPERLDCIDRRELLYKIKFDKIAGRLSADKLRLILQWQEELAQPKEG